MNLEYTRLLLQDIPFSFTGQYSSLLEAQISLLPALFFYNIFFICTHCLEAKYTFRGKMAQPQPHFFHHSNLKDVRIIKINIERHDMTDSWAKWKASSFISFHIKDPCQGLVSNSNWLFDPMTLICNKCHCGQVFISIDIVYALILANEFSYLKVSV